MTTASVAPVRPRPRTRRRRAVLAVAGLGLATLGLTATAPPASAAGVKHYLTPYPLQATNGARALASARFTDTGDYEFRGDVSSAPPGSTNAIYCQYYLRDGSYLWSLVHGIAGSNGRAFMVTTGNSPTIAAQWDNLGSQRLSCTLMSY